ncbi:MAG: prepilin-type N-terminal cleavage/methylation domain-containing protein [Tissierellia bacterium]|nr:prepilin-type N-terminal cleavage/methylation domain-containing protein [Tissierellia bacterium]
MFRIVNKLKNKKGFTLIELIVVLAVLAVIMSIAVPRFVGVQEQAKKDADRATLGLIAKTAELYYVQGKIDDSFEGTGAKISTNESLLADFQKDFPGLEFQTKDEDNEIGDVTIVVNATTGIVTAEWNNLTN